MTLNKVFEQAIKEHCKTREGLEDIKGIKVLKSEFVKTVECTPWVRPNTMMTKYEVICKKSEKPDGFNRVKFQLNFYSDGSDIGVFFDGAYYEAD